MSENSLQGQQNASRFDCVRKHKWGYDPDQVDDFLEKAHEQYDLNNGDLTQELVQSTAFTFTRGGYVIAEVDAALARLEHAIVDRDTARQIASDGRVAWRAETDRLYQLIAGRGERPAGNRFNKGKHRQSSYDVKQVDRIVDQVLVVAADELGVKKMRPSESKSLRDFDSNTIANVIFTQRKGVHGYDEREVDYYLAVCSQLLSRVEAYARLADYGSVPTGMEQTSASAQAAAPVASAGADAGQPAFGSTVKPLFPVDLSADPQPPVAGAEQPVVVPAVPSASSYETVRQTEQTVLSTTDTQAVAQPQSDTSRPEDLGSPSLASLANTTSATVDVSSSASQATSFESPEYSMPGTSPVHPTNDSDNGQNGVSSDEHDMGIPPLSFPLAGN